MMRVKLILGAVLLVLLAGCASRAPIEAQSAKAPPIKMSLLAGGAYASGIVEDRQGNLLRRMTVNITATDWVDGVMQVQEDMRFDNGETATRVWTWRDVGPGRLIGTATGVIGQVEGRYKGAVFTKTYTADTKLPDGSTKRLTYEDWLYRIDDKNLICRSFVTFRGLPVGEATASIRLGGSG